MNYRKQSLVGLFIVLGAAGFLGFAWWIKSVRNRQTDATQPAEAVITPETDRARKLIERIATAAKWQDGVLIEGGILVRPSAVFDNKVYVCAWVIGDKSMKFVDVAPFSETDQAAIWQAVKRRLRELDDTEKAEWQKKANAVLDETLK